MLPLLNRPLPELCFLRRYTGLACPGCGLTRSFISLARGELAHAWAFNPAGVLWFVACAVQVPYRSVQLWRLARGGRTAGAARSAAIHDFSRAERGAHRAVDCPTRHLRSNTSPDRKRVNRRKKSLAPRASRSPGPPCGASPAITDSFVTKSLSPSTPAIYLPQPKSTNQTCPRTNTLAPFPHAQRDCGKPTSTIDQRAA